MKKKDKYGHMWFDRKKMILPFRCKRCGVLSATNEAGEQCKSFKPMINFQSDYQFVAYLICHDSDDIDYESGLARFGKTSNRILYWYDNDSSPIDVFHKNRDGSWRCAGTPYKNCTIRAFNIKKFNQNQFEVGIKL